MKPRSFVTIDDLSDNEILTVFRLADDIIAEMSHLGRIRRIRSKQNWADGRILASLFYEPSTRTRMSFEAAMLRCGGQVISTADARVSSAAKGETIADTARVVESYADLIVIRHPSEGAARVAADFTNVSVINAGDGGHEHPTQTLCDLYTLWVARNARVAKSGEANTDLKFLQGVNVVLHGDLKYGRTIHSLVYGLARFGATIFPEPAPECDLPPHVQRRLLDYNSRPHTRKNDNIDFVYSTPEGPHQLALIDCDFKVRVSDSEARALKRRGIDVFYSTRLQLERFPEPTREKIKQGYPVISPRSLNKPRYKNAKVMHPLPRVDEVSYELDYDDRGVYFQQAAYGVPVRMALMLLLLGLRDGLNQDPPPQEHPVYEGSAKLACENPKCITKDPYERRHLHQSFLLVGGFPFRARCRYCDHEIILKAFKKQHSAKYTLITPHWVDLDEWRSTPTERFVFFEREQDAKEKGYAPKKISS